MTLVLLRDFHFIYIFIDAIKTFQSDYVGIWARIKISSFYYKVSDLTHWELRVTPLATTADLSHLSNPTPIKHLPSNRLPKCKRNERCFFFSQGIEKRITKAFLQCRNRKWYPNLYQYETILLLRHSLWLFCLSTKPFDCRWYAEVIRCSTTRRSCKPVILSLDHLFEPWRHISSERNVATVKAVLSLFSLRPFSEINNADNKMAETIHLRERSKIKTNLLHYVRWDWNTIHLIFYLR